jgi:sugar/nucleoside kinase (ribokinase family)
MNMKKYDAVIAGYLCVDMFPEFNKNEPVVSISALLKPGKLIEIDGLGFSLGGVVANTGMAMKKFNKKVFLNGLIGDDFIGKIARDWLDKFSLSEGIKIAEKAGTAFSIVIAPPGVDRIFLESPGCSKIFDAGYIDFEAISQSRLFHFGYPPLLRQFYLDNGNQLLNLFSRVQEMGVATSLDFSLPDTQSESGKQDWLQIMKRILPYTDIFVPSLEEVLQIMMPGEYAKILSAAGNSDIIDLIPVNTIREIGKTIIDSGVKILLVKAGHRGLYLLTGNVSPLNRKNGFNLSEKDWNYRELWCNAYPADPAKVKNATGAGDTAAAAFLSAILDGKTSESTLKYAAIAGRNNLYCNDIYQDLNDWQDMEKEIKSESNEIICFK